MTEQWRDVEGWEGFYQVSSHGRIYSVPRRSAIGRKIGGRILKGRVTGSGYHMVTFARDCVNHPITVARMVAFAFIPNPDPENLTEVLHIDGDKLNSRVDNLRWVNYETVSAHTDHVLHRANKARGEQIKRARLTADQVIQIRKKHKKWKVTHQNLADEYGVTKSCIECVIRRRTWKHI